MNTTAARRRTARPTALAGLLSRRPGGARHTRLLLWAGLLHRLARALAAISEELARRQRARAAGVVPRPRPAPDGQRHGPPRPRPPSSTTTPQDHAAAVECHHRSISGTDVLTGAAAPHEVGWPGATAPRPVVVGGAAGTWASATRTRGSTAPAPSRCLVHRRGVPRALRYDVAARCSPTGPWRPLR